MKKITWIVDNFSINEGSKELEEAFKFNDVPYLVLPKDYSHSCLEKFTTGKQCVMFHGTIEMTEIIKKQIPNCFPLSYYTQQNYLCSRYLSHFGEYLFNDKYAIISLSELGRQRFLYYGIFGTDALIFIRPDSGQKPFQAQLLDIIDLDNFLKRNAHLSHELVVVSSPKNIKWEGRFIVSKNKEIISYSTYQFQGQVTKIPSVPYGSLELVKKILDVEYFPDSVFCIDICQDADNNYWLLEINSFSSAGLYACNKNTVVEKVSEIAISDFEKSF